MEKRAYPRIEISFPVECGLLAQNSYFYTVSKNVSIGGLKIIANEFLSKNSLVKIHINLIDRLLKAKAKVNWCNKEPVAERYFVGLEFLEMEEEDRQLLIQFINHTYNS